MSTAAAVSIEPRNGAGVEDRLHNEFDRQLGDLLAKGYPEAAGMSPMTFMCHVEPLRRSLAARAAFAEPAVTGRIPFVIVIAHDLVARHTAMERVERRDKAGFSVLEPDDLRRFEPIEDVRLPSGFAYLLFDVDTGKDTLNVTPDEALVSIRRRRRTPLTIDEGIALITHHPEAVAKNGGFSLAGSRCGDRRVTALWISQNRPKLGWCWAGNPHTWLGTASCADRAAGRGGPVSRTG